MANITVTTSSNFDDSANLGLANGDTITINSGAVLTIDSDVRWGQNAAVPRLVTINEGELKIDGSQTWWIPFDASTGNVPSLGTRGTQDVTVSGSNVGEFLGVFTALGVAPSTAGTAMPATGFIKLRSKSATINDNDVLTFSGGATATVNSSTGGQRGWIHFVGREASAGVDGVANALGLGKITSTGDWFYLGTSDGTSGQAFQFPVADYCPGIQVETGSGTNVFEWYGCANAADWTAANLSTDDRSKFFISTPTGLIAFGGGTYGKLPPNGARLRIPNVIVSSTTAANYAANTTNTTNPDYRWTFYGNPGDVDINYQITNGCIISQSCASFQVQNSAIIDCGLTRNSGQGHNFSTYILNNIACSNRLGVNQPMIYCYNSSSVNITDVYCFKTPSANSNGYHIGFGATSNITCTRMKTFNLQSISSICNISFCGNVLLDDCAFVGQGLYQLNISNSYDIIVRNNKFDSKLVGAAAGSVLQFILANNTRNVLIDGFGYFLTGLPTGYEAINGSGLNNFKIRNIGSRSTNFNYPSRYLLAISGCNGFRAARVYSIQSGGYNNSPFSISNSKNVSINDCGQVGGATNQVTFSGTVEDAFAKRTISSGSKLYATTITAGRTNTVFNQKGLHFTDQEVSSTEIWLTVYCGSKKTTSDFSVNSYTDDAGTPIRDNQNGLQLRNVGDQVTWTWTYWILGLTGFANTAPILSGTNTGNLTLTYDLDKGTGFSGTFKTLSAANLNAETGILATGVKLRIRAVCSTANSANSISAITVVGSTTSATLAANLYPYNNPVITLSNGQSGSLAAIFRESDGKLLDVVSISQPRLYPGWYADTACTLRVRKAGWYQYQTSFTLTETDTSFYLTQMDSGIADTNPGALAITLTDHGASPVTWNGKQFSITVTVTDGSSAADIARYLSYNTSLNSYSINSSYHNMAWPEMVIPSDGSYETQRGTLFGSAGATYKGVRVIDGSGNAISGFARMQADDGTYYTEAFTESSNLVVSDVGEVELLDKMLKDALSVDENYTLKLYKNNYTPGGSSTAANFTEADFTNYTAKTLNRSNWSAATSVANKAQSSYSNQTWTCGTTGNTIYGYYIVGATSGVLLWAEKFALARIIGDTDTITVTPRFTLNSKY